MIGANAEASVLLVAEWKASTGWDVSADDLSSFERILASASVPGFPGGILPWPRTGKRTVFYAVSRNSEDWRRLRPLVVAFAGPTLTGFAGAPHRPNPKWGSPEEFLASNGFAAVARLVPADDAQAQRIVLWALDQLCRLVLENPAAERRASEPTSRLLGRLEGALADGDRTAATTLHTRLRAEDRLDALNLTYLSIEIAAAFRDWTAIVEMPELIDIVASPRPAAVTTALLEAFYAMRIAPAEEEGKVGEVLQELAPLLRDLLAQPRPPLGAGAARLAELADAEARAGPNLAPSPGRESAPTSPVSASPTEAAMAGLVDAARKGSLEALRAAVEVVDGLDAADRERLLGPAWVRELWRETSTRAGRVALPRTWCEWLALLPLPEFTNALDVARTAAAEWTVEQQIGDPALAAELASLLLATPEGAATERLAEALPVLIAWLRRDPRFPRASLRSVYDALWTLLVLGVRRGEAELESSAALFDGLLACGLPHGRYRELLRDALDLIGDPGRRSTYWILGLVESTVDQPAPDGEARQNFLATALSRVDRFRAHLSPLQCAALSRLAETLGLPAQRVAEDEAGITAIGAALQGRRVAVYTLTESAGRQAAAALTELVPSLTVTLHADHVGSQALKAAAEGSDLFVVVTWSAKHAATDFIRRHRPAAKPLLYAPGRGATSILRALDEYLSR